MSPVRTSRFPDPTSSLEEGLVAVGGVIEPDWLLDAYRHGIFPWPMSEESEGTELDSEPDSEEGTETDVETDADLLEEPMLWWSPDPRAIIPLEGMHISKRLRRTLRANKFRVTCDTAFADVLIGCAEGPGREEGTWLSPEMQAAYQLMHQLGHAHSVEVWLDDKLAGGVYGLGIGALFAAESMFHYETNASKVAVAHLVVHLRLRGYQLLDIQQWTEHTGSLGAVEISRAEYLKQLPDLIDLPIAFGDKLATETHEW